MLEFIESEHLYIMDGIIVPSVSEFLAWKFGDRYKSIPKHILNNKADYGTLMHKAIECFESGQELPKLSYIQEASMNQYYKLKEKYKMVVRQQEQMVSYQDLYAGRYDMLMTIRDEISLSLADIKTTAKLDREYLSWQLSLYESADLGGKGEYGHLYAIWLPKKQLAELVEVDRVHKEELLRNLEEYKEYRNNRENF